MPQCLSVDVAKAQGPVLHVEGLRAASGELGEWKIKEEESVRAVGGLRGTEHLRKQMRTVQQLVGQAQALPSLLSSAVAGDFCLLTHHKTCHTDPSFQALPFSFCDFNLKGQFPKMGRLKTEMLSSVPPSSEIVSKGLGFLICGS